MSVWQNDGIQIGGACHDVHFYIHIKSKKRERDEEKIYGNSTADKGKPK